MHTFILNLMPNMLKMSLLMFLVSLYIHELHYMNHVNGVFSIQNGKM